MGAHRHAHLAEDAVDLLNRVLLAPAVQRGAELRSAVGQRLVQALAAGLARDGGVGTQRLEVGIVGEPEELDELLHRAGAAHGYLAVAVLALLRAGARAHEVFVADAHGLYAVVDAVGQRGALQAHERLELAAVDGLAFARLARADDSGKRGPSTHETGHEVAGEGLRHAGRAVGEAVEVRIARERLADGVERRLAHVVRVAPVAETGNMQDDQRRVRLPQHLVGKAPLLPGTALRRLHQHVGPLHHLQQDLLALGRGDVQRDHALVATVDRPCVAVHAVHVGRHRAFQLDDVGALLGEQLADERRRDDRAGVEHLQVLQVAELGAIR